MLFPKLMCTRPCRTCDRSAVIWTIMKKMCLGWCRQSRWAWVQIVSNMCLEAMHILAALSEIGLQFPIQAQLGGFFWIRLSSAMSKGVDTNYTICLAENTFLKDASCRSQILRRLKQRTAWELERLERSAENVTRWAVVKVLRHNSSPNRNEIRINPHHSMSALQQDMLLFVMFLFQNLPHYVPKTTIIFSTMLGVS